MKQFQLTEVFYELMASMQANLHTITIGKVVKVNGTTIDCQPVIARKVNDKTIPLPVFAEVPVVFMQGGASYTTYPIAVGDYCLLLVNERCFDAWHNGQENVEPLEKRMHDYSDCFALVGVKPLAGALTIPDKITQNGNAFYNGTQDIVGDTTILGDLDLTGNLNVIGNVTITGETEINGNLVVNGTIAAEEFTGIEGGPLESSVDIISNGISLQTHVHSAVESGPSNSGPPV